MRVPAGNLVGQEGKGLSVALGTLDHSRLGVAAQAVGIAQGATDYAAAYARERKQFGQPINEFQAIQFKLADMETKTAAARELLYKACAKIDRHEPDRGKYSAMAKLFASDTAMDVTIEAVQVLGGYGYVTEYPVERYLRDAKITQIYEGTNEIQRARDRQDDEVMLSDWPAWKRISTSALFCLCIAVLIITIFRGLAPDYPLRLFQGVAAAVAGLGLLGMGVAAITTRLGDYQDPADEEEFELLVRQSERLARENLAAEPDESDFLALDPRKPDDFEELVREALDDLPDLLHKALDHVAVVISDKGRRHRAYGLYQGDTAARDNYPDRIIIFRDTLLRDFGHDPDELRAQVTRTVRHELAHHLGADELGVRELGL